jgi:uncharacterized phage protein (TIGR01671 family)
MRDIKFRAWDPVEKKMYEPDFIDNKNMCPVNFAGGYWEDGLEVENNHILMQYTGLKGKNGVEIYEGDILSRKDWGMGGGHDPEERYEVGLINDYIYEEEQLWHFKVHLWGEWCEVIGNIYENPDLLKS